MWLCSPLIAENITRKIVDALLMLTLKTCQQSLDVEKLYTKMHTVIIDSQWIMSKYNHLNPKASRPRDFWCSTIRIIVAIDVDDLSCYSPLGGWFSEYISIHYSLTYIARLPQLSSSSSFCLCSQPYHKQFWKSRWCARGLYGQVCSWMHLWMEHDGCQ